MKWRILGLAALLAASFTAQADTKILNTSYDVSRELFKTLNPLFEADWKAKTGKTVAVEQSHAGSSRQAQAILQGLQADVVTFNQTTDVDVLKNAGFVAADWQQRLGNNASPFYSTIAFLVRKGNPKNIQNWDDLARDGVRLVFPNPKTSGNARYTYLASWLFAQEQFNKDEAKTQDFVGRILNNVAVFDTGGRGATTTFVERGIGDVLLSFESEVNGIRKQYGDQDFEVIVPPVSILAEFPVAVVDRVVDKRKTRDVATAYLDFLYTPAAQQVLADFSYRVAGQSGGQFPAVRLLKVEDHFSSWADIQKTHFANGGLLDQLQAKGKGR